MTWSLFLHVGAVLSSLFGIAYAGVTLRWLHRPGQRQPRPPRNVRAIFPDGRVQPLEVVYGGRDAAGMHRWLVTELLPLVEGLQVTGDRLDAHSSIGWGCYVGDPPGP